MLCYAHAHVHDLQIVFFFNLKVKSLVWCVYCYKYRLLLLLSTSMSCWIGNQLPCRGVGCWAAVGSIRVQARPCKVATLRVPDGRMD